MSAFLFGTVGSPTSTPPKPGGSVGAIQRMAELNLSALELGWVQSVRVTEATCAAIRAEAQRQSILLSVHAPYFINLNATVDEWPKSRKRLLDAAYYGNLAGATDIIFHPGSYFGEAAETVLEVAIPRLRGCIEDLHNSGNPVILRPETMGKSAMLGSLSDTLAMSNEIPGVLPCLDFAHLHARAGDGTVNSYSEFQQIINDYANILGLDSLQNLHIHLSGIEYTLKGEKNHMPIQESDLRIHDLFKALHDAGCAGRILCESPLMEIDALFMKEIYPE
jgi:deoxyribonuclease-4